jgi:2-polyprenyl-3-methyl-5-hydroxy-6-metoxy-1,4-benzoquinol methylase
MAAEVIGPGIYRPWRASPLGATTEALEQALVLRLAGPLVGKRVLDVGCGDGAYALAAARQGAQVVGVDGSRTMLTAARARANEAGLNVEFEQADVMALPFEDGRFDLVLTVTVLCFLPDPAAALREIARVLAPGGRLVLSELGRWNAWAAWRRLRAWAGSPLWRAATFHSAADLRALVSEAGLGIERVNGAVFYPPLAGAARLLARIDPWLGRRTTLGAAFIAVAAVKPRTGSDANINGGGTP